MKIYKKVNAAYKVWRSFPYEPHMTNLLSLVRQSVVQKFAKEDKDFEDIAQNVLIQIWKDLLANKFDPERGDFATYVATVARTARLKFHRSDRMLACSQAFIEEAQLNPALTMEAFLRSRHDPVKFMGE